MLSGNYRWLYNTLAAVAAGVVEHRGDMVERLTGVPGAEVKIVFVELTGHKIELIEYSRPAEKKTSDLRNCDPGAFHIALEVDDIEAAASVAQDHGFTAFSAPQTVCARSAAARRSASAPCSTWGAKVLVFQAAGVALPPNWREHTA